MPAGEFEIHPEALLEADAGLAWYLERSRAAAERLFFEVERAIELILESPDRWSTHLHGTRRYVLHGFPYGIIYRAVDSRVIVYAVAHAKRRPGYWKSRLTWGGPPIV
ncbi:MAG TPA: type II toxin-antitoxin system RelE/ParE family toxin [Vicinamibacteria bacterium]|nr:type II toxin-antitoxin system RelE/ParE family toxin [Vicinamibacteria bacterium]